MLARKVDEGTVKRVGHGLAGGQTINCGELRLLMRIIKKQVCGSH
jgi:hypothetical protein